MDAEEDTEPSGEPSAESPPINPPGPDWLFRWRQRIAGDNRYRQLVWRVVATALGVGIVITGIVLLPLPGPGWAIIFLGLAVLATEYAWAHRLLVFTRDKA
ncbi:MAG: PGPGW domain-containing protein, partial [Actinomycetes bacterium]